MPQLTNQADLKEVPHLIERRRREKNAIETLDRNACFLVRTDALTPGGAGTHTHGTGINLFVIKGVHQKRSASRTFRMRSQNGEKRLAYPGRT